VVRPAAEVTAMRAEIDVLDHEEFDCEFVVRNTSDWVSCRVDLSPVQTEQPQLVSLEDATPGPFVSLKPGAVEKFTVHGVSHIESSGGPPMGQRAPRFAFVFSGMASTALRRSSVT